MVFQESLKGVKGNKSENTGHWAHANLLLGCCWTVCPAGQCKSFHQISYDGTYTEFN